MANYPIQAGELRTQITFQQPIISKDAGAAQVVAWANVASNGTVWARWIMAHGQEVVNSDALKSVQRAVVTIRHRTDVLTSWRVLKDGQAWQVISVDPIQGKNRWVELVVEQARGTV
jgi:SPP1 family predicted phage head-tail adaptor